MGTSRTPETIIRRGELLAEVFLSDLGAKTISRSPFDSVDLLVFFESDDKAMQVVAVEVRVKEPPVPNEFEVPGNIVARAAKSNIPTLLLVVDPKNNKFKYAWLDEISRKISMRAKSIVRVPLIDAEKRQDGILDRILGVTHAVT